MIRRVLLATLICSCYLLTRVATGATAIEVRVAASTDDAMTETGSVIYLTEQISEFKSAYLSNGFRFLNVTVPQGSVIDSAVIFFTSNETTTGAVTLNIVGEDADDAATFSTYSDYAGRSRTTATQSWAIATGDQWSSGTPDAYKTVDFADVVQEITDRGGWASGNDMVIFIDYASEAGARNTYTYNSSSSTCPKIRIVYSSGTCDSSLSTPTLSTPTDGNARVRDDDSTGWFVAFDWTDSDTGATGYQFQLDDNSDFGSTILDSSWFATSALTLPKYYQLNAGVEYFWRARGRNACDTSDWPTAFSFFAGETLRYSWADSGRADANDVSTAQISEAEVRHNFGALVRDTLGAFTTYERHGVMRFDKLMDSVRAYKNATGTWSFDSLRIRRLCSVTPGTNDSLQLGLIRLKTGRWFIEGVQSTGAQDGGVCWDSCVQIYNDGYTGINWSTDGAIGTDDTIGGVLDYGYASDVGPKENNFLRPNSPSTSEYVFWNISTASEIDSMGWVIVPSWSGGTYDGTACRIALHSDDVTTATSKPMYRAWYKQINLIADGAPSTVKGRRRILQQLGSYEAKEFPTWCQVEKVW